MKGFVWPTAPWYLALVTILGAALEIGCLPGDPSRNTVANLDGRLVTDRPIVVAPNRHWLPRPEDGAWGLLASAEIAVLLQESSSSPMVFSLQLENGSPDRLHFAWDGQQLPEPRVTTEGRRVEVTVEPAELAKGVHSLRVSRRLGQAGWGSAPRRVFISDLGFRLNAQHETLDPADSLRYSYLASFLGQGVTGSRSTERLGGILFEGPRSVEVSIGRRQSGDFRAKVLNTSPSPAVFRLRQGQTEVVTTVESHGKAILRAPVDGHGGPLTLGVDGHPSGYYLWGAPHLRDTREADGVPIVLVTLDTTRRDVIPPYAKHGPNLPNLREFARRGTVHRHAVTTSPWTLPAHASLFTGLYPSRHRAGVVDQELGGSFVTLAELLRTRGYVNAGFAGGRLCSSFYGLAQGFHIYLDPTTTQTPGDQLTDAAVEFLEQYGDTRLFLFINYFDPHFPYVVHERIPENDRRYESSRAPSDATKVLAGEARAWAQAIKGKIDLGPQQLARMRSAYRSEVGFMDRQLGRLFQALKQHGLFDRSLIVVAADHGEFLGENGWYGHGYRLDPELVRIPLIVKYPDQNEQERDTRLVSIVDLFPTILRAANIPEPTSDGLPLGSSRESSRQRFVISEEHSMGIHRLFSKMKVDDHLYSIDQTKRREVLWTDGYECFTLSKTAWQPEACTMTRAEAEARLRGVLPRALHELESSHEVIPDEEERRRLRALGYLE
jgi:hypothetical protein